MKHWQILSGVYEMELGLGTAVWQGALQELETCTASQKDHYRDQDDLGAESLTVSAPNCDAVLEYFNSDSWYQALVELCQQDPQWSINWVQPSVSWFRNFTRFGYHWHRVPGNYHRHGWHVDCLRIVAHGMMYMSPGYPTVESTQTPVRPRSLRQSLAARTDQTRLSTTLFRDTDKEVDIPVTTGVDRGWIVLQTGRQLHRGVNLAQSPRYTFKWTLALDI